MKNLLVVRENEPLAFYPVKLIPLLQNLFFILTLIFLSSTRQAPTPEKNNAVFKSFHCQRERNSLKPYKRHFISFWLNTVPLIFNLFKGVFASNYASKQNFVNNKIKLCLNLVDICLFYYNFFS